MSHTTAAIAAFFAALWLHIKGYYARFMPKSEKVYDGTRFRRS